MDSLIEKLPSPIRTLIRPDPFVYPESGEPLLKDALDFRPAAMNRKYDKEIKYISFPGGLKVGLGVNNFIDVLSPMPVFFAAESVLMNVQRINSPYEVVLGAVAPFIITFLKRTWDIVDSVSVPSREEEILEDAEYRTTHGVYSSSKVTQFVYSGKETLKVEGLELNKGDNYWYLHLPELERENLKSALPPEVIAKWVERVDKNLTTKKLEIKRSNYKAVVIELPTIPIFWGEKAEGRESTRDQVFAGKKTPIKDPEKRVIVIPREEFESLSVLPGDILLEAGKELRDPTMTHLMTMVEKEFIGADTPYFLKLRKLIEKRANQILRREIEANFNGPESVMTRDENYAPIRHKLHPLSQLLQTSGGYSFRQTVGLTGEVRITPLQRLLKIGEDLPTAIKNPGKYKKAQMAFIIQQVVRSFDMPSLKIELPYEDKQGGPYRFKDQTSGIEKTFVNIEKEKKGQWKFQVLQRGRAFLSTLILYSALRTAGVQLARGIDEYMSAHPQMAPISERSIFPKRVPVAGLDWKLRGGDTEGYWALSTSHEFKDGGWTENKVVAKTYVLPESVEENPDLIHVENVIALTQFGDSKIKIPIRQNSKMVAVSVKDMRGEKIASRVNEMDDGTMEVVIPFSLIGNKAWVSIDATLMSTDIPTVHATQKIPSINTGRFNKEATRYREYLDFVTHYNDNEPNLALASMIAGSKKYSINPPDADRINLARDGEDYVNAQAEMEAGDCETANTLIALENSAVPDAPKINPTVGYISDDTHLAGGSGNYLRSEAFHRFNINGWGSIIDATPYIPADDTMTQEYIKLLHGDKGAVGVNSSASPISIDPWNERITKIQEIAEKEKEIADIEKEIGLGVGAITLGAVTYKSARILAAWKKKRDEKGKEKMESNKENETPENLPIVLQKEYKPSVFEGFNESEIAKSVNFFGWLSYGRREIPSNLEIPLRDVSTPEQAFEQLKRNVNPYKIAQYIEDPKAYEKHYGLSEQEAENLRMVAMFLVG